MRNGGRDRGRDELERAGQSGESEENGDGGRQMARDERKIGSGRETEINRERQTEVKRETRRERKVVVFFSENKASVGFLILS